MRSGTVLSAHIGYLFNDRPLLDRLDAARGAGFDAVECPIPASVSAQAFAARLRETSLTLTQLAVAPGDPDKGEKGLAALPGREEEFMYALAQALDFSELTGCGLVHPLAGIVPADMSAGTVSATYRANLERAAKLAENWPIEIIVEPISHAAVPRYWMNTIEKALRLIEEAAGIPVRLLIDTYHAASNSEDSIGLLEHHVPMVAHVHIADFPGRHEPGSGAIDFDPLIDWLARADYAGAYGFEYQPSATDAESLLWLPAWKQRLSRGNVNHNVNECSP